MHRIDPSLRRSLDAVRVLAASVVVISHLGGRFDFGVVAPRVFALIAFACAVLVFLAWLGDNRMNALVRKWMKR